MAWYDEIVRRDRIASEAPMGWRWMRDKAFNLLGTDMPQVARNQARNIGGALKQPRPRYAPWQNQMVDPNHPGGAVKYGVYPASPAGENMLLGGLAGSLLPLLPLRSIPSVYKPLGRVLPRVRITPHMGGRPPGAVRPRRDWARPLMRPGTRRTPDPQDLGLGYKTQPTWKTFRKEPFHPRITPEQLARMRRDYTLHGTPSRLTKGGRPYRPMKLEPEKGNRLSRWWRFNNPWM